MLVGGVIQLQTSRYLGKAYQGRFDVYYSATTLRRDRPVKNKNIKTKTHTGLSNTTKKSRQSYLGASVSLQPVVTLTTAATA